MITRCLPAALFGLALTLPASAQIVLPGGGSGGGGGSGVSSLTTNCPAAGPLTGAVTLNGYLSNSRSVSGTTDTLASTDGCGIVQYTNSGSIAVTIAASGSTGFTAPGYWVGIKNSGAGTITVTPASGTINGNSTLSVAANSDLQLVAFGSGTYITMNMPPTTVPGFSQVIATYHPLWPTLTVTNGTAPGANTIVCSPFIATFNQHWDQIVTRISITGSAGGNIQVAIYPDGLNATSGAHQPVGAATYSSGSLANTGSVGNVITWAMGTSGVGLAIAQGPNWACLNTSEGTGAVNSLSAASTYIGSLIGAISAGNAGSTVNTVGLKITGQTFGTWPTFTTSTAFTEITNANAPSYAYRIATTP